MATRQAAVGVAAPGSIASQGMVAEAVAPAMAVVRRFSRKSLYTVKLKDYYMASLDEKQIQSKSGYIIFSNSLKISAQHLDRRTSGLFFLHAVVTQ